MYLPKEVLLKRARDLLGVEQEYMEKHLMDLSIERKIVIREIKREGAPVQTAVYAASYYQVELHVAQMLHTLNLQDTVKEDVLEEKIERIQRGTGVELDEKQKEAVREAVKNGLLIITGGPGTGKTTTINAIIRYFEMEDLDICLAAPTGRAAKRMTETTGYEAKTIHRLLELSGGPEQAQENVRFERNAQNPLEADVIIIDEMSMVDIFFDACTSFRCGFRYQADPGGRCEPASQCGTGQCTEGYYLIRLLSCCRIGEDLPSGFSSDIVVNAHKINQGIPVVLDNKSRDFFFLKRYDAQRDHQHCDHSDPEKTAEICGSIAL